MLQEIQISSFTAGEFSPRMKGRTDYQRYYDSLDTCRNMVPMPQGGLTKRPGTLYVEAAHDQTATPFRVRNIPFVFSTVQPYSLEFGPGYIRPFMDDAAILGATDRRGPLRRGRNLAGLLLPVGRHLVAGPSELPAGDLDPQLAHRLELSSLSAAGRPLLAAQHATPPPP